jgi:lipopolysaccharide export LptBFGC system permease protein LptF
MGQTPTPTPPLRTPLIVGGVIAGAAVVLFIVLWVILGSAGVSNTQRLFISLCVPPAFLAAGVGAFVLFRRPANPS